MKEIKYNGLLREDIKTIKNTMKKTNADKALTILGIITGLTFITNAVLVFIYFNLALYLFITGINMFFILGLKKICSDVHNRRISINNINDLTNSLKKENINVEAQDIVSSHKEKNQIIRTSNLKVTKESKNDYFCMLSNEEKLVVLKQVRDYLNNNNNLYLLNNEEIKEEITNKRLRLTR